MAPRKKVTSKKRGRAKSASSGTDEKQSARFIEMAQTLGADESGEKFKNVFTAIVPSKKRERP
jgi:hypothetical protein